MCPSEYSFSYILILIPPANKEISERIIRRIEGVIIEEIAALGEAAFACRDAVCDSLPSPFALVVGSVKISDRVRGRMSGSKLEKRSGHQTLTRSRGATCTRQRSGLDHRRMPGYCTYAPCRNLIRRESFSQQVLHASSQHLCVPWWPVRERATVERIREPSREDDPGRLGYVDVRIHLSENSHGFRLYFRVTHCLDAFALVSLRGSQLGCGKDPQSRSVPLS